MASRWQDQTGRNGMKLKHTRTLLAGFALALALLGGVAWLDTSHRARMDAAAQWVTHTERVRDGLDRLLIQILNVETGVRGFVITDVPEYLESFQSSIGQVDDEFRAVRALTRDNPQQQKNLEALEPVLTARMDYARFMVKLRQESGFEAAQQEMLLGKGKAMMDQIRALLARLNGAELALLNQRSAEVRQEAHTQNRIAATGTGLSFVLLIAVFALVLRGDHLRQGAQQQLDRFFTLPLDLLCIADTDGYFKRLNPAFHQLLGYPTDELRARPFLDFVHPEDRAATLAEVAKLSQGETTVQFENRYSGKDGAWHWLSWKAQTLPGEGLIYATARDVTALKAATEALRTSEENYRAIVESSPDCLKLLNLDGRLTQMGTRSCRLMEVDDFSQIKNAEWLLFWKGEAHAQASHAVAAALAGGTGRFQGFCPTLKGTPKWWDVIVTAIHGPDGKVRELLAVSRDITEQKEAAAALNESQTRRVAIFTNTLDGVITIDKAGRVVEWNPAAEKLFGYPLSEVMGQELAELIVPPRLREAHRRGIAHLLATGEGPVLRKLVELPAMRADGTEFPIELLITPLGTQPPLFTGFIRDITARKQAEEAIRVLNASLERRVQERTAALDAANQELESFSYSVSHDLRAPLRHIHGYVEMLTAATAGQLTEKPRHYLQTIAAASEEMGELIDDLLAFSCMSRTELSKTRISLDELVQDTLRGLELAVRGRNIQWQIAPLPPVVGDAAMLKQVFANLLGNAVKYSRPRDPAHIEIGCAGEEDGRIILFVRDNGVGFDIAYAHKLFGVFQRLHRADEFEGTGIGLATVQRIIARHGGRVWAEAELDRGATFYFTLQQDFSAAKERTELKA